MENKKLYLEDENCAKCGGKTRLNYIRSSGMDLEPAGMKRICNRCGYSEFIKSLDNEKKEDNLPA